MSDKQTEKTIQLDTPISSPALTAQEIAEMDPADLTAMSVEVVTFLLKKSVLAGLPTA